MIWNLGSINIDMIYRVPHLPVPGETLAATGFFQGLGGKGTNMSVAAARAGSRVVHIGAVGEDGRWAVDRLLEYGIEVPHIATVAAPTGTAIIYVDDAGENSIVLNPSANWMITKQMIGAALSVASSGDYLLLQNETNKQRYAVETAKLLGLRVLYAAAPFDVEAVRAVMSHVDVLVLNAVEAQQLAEGMGKELTALPIPDIIVTLGADGCKWISNTSKKTQMFDAYPVDAVDTTGAGDTFTGFMLSGLDRKIIMADAIDMGLRAAALMVSRHGTADVIPDLKEIQDHLF
jgi:ribokinase